MCDQELFLVFANSSSKSTERPPFTIFLYKIKIKGERKKAHKPLFVENCRDKLTEDRFF
jgi:hypothetical protein